MDCSEWRRCPHVELIATGAALRSLAGDGPPRRTGPHATARPHTTTTERLAAAQRRWLQLRLHIGGQMGSGELGPGLLLVFEGRDAAGKGGAIKRVVEPLDPRHYRVLDVRQADVRREAPPVPVALLPVVPGLGGMSVFDRSWYGRVLVERVEGFATDEQWSRAYEEIVSFERTIALEGVILVKFWLQISDDEQLRRFEDRAERSAAAVEDHRRGLAQPQEAERVRRSPPRTCSSAPTTTSRRGT